MDREELLKRYAAGERDFSGLDFSELDLSHVKNEQMLAQVDYPPYAMGKENYPLNCCIFRGANFSFANFSSTHIMYCDFRDTICFRANFFKSNFSGTDFTGADMWEANLNALEGIGVIFDNVDFRGCGSIGSFVHERTLCLRNCIGQDGKIIELFNEQTLIEQSEREYVDEWNGIPISELLGEKLKKPRILGDDVIPF